FGIVAATLEALEVYEDLRKTNEVITTKVKFSAIVLMGIGSAFQLLTGIFPSTAYALIAMSPWFSVAILLAGAVYLFATMALNYFKQDSIGWWLRRCCWSRSIEYRYPANAEGQHEEKLALLTIQLSPQIHVKSTTRDETRYFGRDSPHSVPVQYGAGVQVLLPNAVRGQSVHFNIISSKRPLGVLPVEKIDNPIHWSFLDRGQFKNTDYFGKLSNQPVRNACEDFTYPLMPPEDEAVVWETWAPLDKEATYLELQIWYSSSLIKSGKEDTGYLFQLELTSEGKTTFDGLISTELEIKTTSRIGNLTLEIAE
ncbi:hypothetical protein, partial [Pseudomonas syringae]